MENRNEMVERMVEKANNIVLYMNGVVQECRVKLDEDFRRLGGSENVAEYGDNLMQLLRDAMSELERLAEGEKALHFSGSTLTTREMPLETSESGYVDMYSELKKLAPFLVHTLEWLEKRLGNIAIVATIGYEGRKIDEMLKTGGRK